jgi:hypothetical protein
LSSSLICPSPNKTPRKRRPTFVTFLCRSKRKISSALTGKRTRIAQPDEDESEDELANSIRTSIPKRSRKEGTRIVKKSKGKDKIAKGEVGGGSFQSMGSFQIA